MCTPQRRSDSATPIFASIDVTASTWMSSPPWLAQASASSASVKPKCSGPPSRTKGSAWNGLSVERENTHACGSPAWASSAPVASTTATEPQ
jgi:hypothetical protein